MIDGSKKRKPLLRFEFQSSHVIVNRNNLKIVFLIWQLAQFSQDKIKQVVPPDHPFPMSRFLFPLERPKGTFWENLPNNMSEGVG